MIGMDKPDKMASKDHLARFDNGEDAQKAVDEVAKDGGRWEKRYSAFGGCWLVASLSPEGYLLGYLLKE